MSSSSSLRRNQNDKSPAQEPRRLAIERLAGYKPMTDITDRAKLDYDLALIESFVNLNKETEAVTIYKEGGYSQSIARLTIKNADPPRMPIPEGTKVVGYSDKGLVIKGVLVETATWTSNTDEVILLVEYEAKSESNAYCHLGGLVVMGLSDHSGCYMSEGSIKIVDLQEGAPEYVYNYTYQHMDDTYNGRTLQMLSTEIDMSFGSSKHCDKFASYYGGHDYGNTWIEAALLGKDTELANGNADFSKYDSSVRKEVLLAGPKVMNVWMYVIRMMEYAVNRCSFPCGQAGGDRCDVIPVQAWDQAFAFYAGDLEGPNGDGHGVFLYDLANKMCQEFKTCTAAGNEESGTASVNLRVVDLFSQGQLSLLKRECDVAEKVKDDIVNLMTVPLIQSALQSAHHRNFTKSFEEVKGATYAASILPIIHHCNPDDAETIYSNLGLGQSNQTIETLAVKQAFERNYDCLGVTCEDIGGVWEGKYYGQYSTPCNYRPPKTSNNTDSTGALMVVVIVCFLLIPMMLGGFFIYHRKKIHKLTTENAAAVYDEDSADGTVHAGIPERALATVNLD